LYIQYQFVESGSIGATQEAIRRSGLTDCYALLMIGRPNEDNNQLMYREPGLLVVDLRAKRQLTLCSDPLLPGEIILMIDRHLQSLFKALISLIGHV
jgi:hypothetical protein